MAEHSGLLTDLYELTMAAGYLQTRFDAKATFELFVRHLPPKRNFLVAAGLEQVLDFLEHVHFTADEISFLRKHPVFCNIRDEFFDYLATFRFTGRCLGHAGRKPGISRRATLASGRANHRRPDHGNLSAGHAELSNHDRE